MAHDIVYLGDISTTSLQFTCLGLPGVLSLAVVPGPARRIRCYDVS